MDQNSKGRMYKRIFVGFFMVMLFCTFVSRIYDSVTVPKVITSSMGRKTIENVISGSGTIREKQTEFADVTAGLKVGFIPVIPGSVVNTGDTLFAYEIDSLLEKKRQWGRDLEKLELDLEAQAVSAEVYPGVSQSELAAFEVQTAKRELVKGQQDYEKTHRDYLDRLEWLKEDYERKMTLTEDELWEQQNSQYESARRALSQNRRTRDMEVRTAARRVDDLEEQIGKLQDEGNHNEEISQLERELERAMEDMDDLIDSWDRQIEDGESELDMIDHRGSRIESGEASSLDVVKESYETAVKQQEDLLAAAQKEVNALVISVDKAEFHAANAVRTDEQTRLTNNQKKRLSELIRKGLQLDMEDKKQELLALEELIQAEGIVEAWTDGTVVQQELLAGKQTTGEELLSIATGALQFEGTFLKDKQELAVGDVLSITIPGTSRKLETKVNRLNLLGEDGIFQADTEKLQSSLGAVTDYECRKQSDVYDRVIPLTGLRKDMKGYYCLVVQSKSAILGEEFEARRVDVQVLYEGSTDVAIDGPIQEEDRIIVRSSKIIGEGDRVRMVSEL